MTFGPRAAAVAVLFAGLGTSGCLCPSGAAPTFSEFPTDARFWCLLVEDGKEPRPLDVCFGSWPLCGSGTPAYITTAYLSRWDPPREAGPWTYAPGVVWSSGTRYALVVRSERAGWQAWWWNAGEVATHRNLPWFSVAAVDFDLSRATSQSVTEEQLDAVDADHVDQSLARDDELRRPSVERKP